MSGLAAALGGPQNMIACADSLIYAPHEQRVSLAYHQCDTVRKHDRFLHSLYKSKLAHVQQMADTADDRQMGEI